LLLSYAEAKFEGSPLTAEPSTRNNRFEKEVDTSWKEIPAV
jgi:hypothetical protein